MIALQGVDGIDLELSARDGDEKSAEFISIGLTQEMTFSFAVCTLIWVLPILMILFCYKVFYLPSLYARGS